MHIRYVLFSLFLCIRQTVSSAGFFVSDRPTKRNFRDCVDLIDTYSFYPLSSRRFFFVSNNDLSDNISLRHAWTFLWTLREGGFSTKEGTASIRYPRK